MLQFQLPYIIKMYFYNAVNFYLNLVLLFDVNTFVVIKTFNLHVNCIISINY